MPRKPRAPSPSPPPRPPRPRPRKAGIPERETDLYASVRDLLERQGFTVRGEVRGCDVVAQRGEDLVIVELKRHFGLDLLLQAVVRQRACESVYVALPAAAVAAAGRRWVRQRQLLRRLELGLLLVHCDGSPSPHVEVALHPVESRRQLRRRGRRALIEEIAGRSGDHQPGGTTRRKILTAYREAAIRIAVCLQQGGPASPRSLRAEGCSPRTTSILSDNHYGWFTRTQRGIYALTEAGRADLAGPYAEAVERMKEKG